MKLIDKSALVAEIEKLKGKVSDSSSYCNGWQHALRMLEIELNTLEVKEVDLDEEFDKYCDNLYLIELKYELYAGLFECAKHFFELGLKAKDWKKERMEECPYRQVGCTMYEGHILECRGACSWVVDYPKLKELKAQKEEV